MSALVLTTTDAVHDVLVGDIALDRRGAWVAHLELSGDLDLSGPVALTLAGENEGIDADFVGFVRRSKAWNGRTRTVVVGGAGGLMKALPPRDHIAGVVPLTALLVAARIALEAGETLAPASLPALSALSLSRWLRVGPDEDGHGGTALEALDLLTEHLGLVWRVLDDGTIWIGVDAFPDSTANIGETWIDDGDDGRIDCAPPVATPRPGESVLGHPIERVTFRVTGAAARAELLYPVNATPSKPLAPLVYREVHDAQVVAQNPDGTLDLKVDDERIAELRKVPFRAGIPGCTFVIPAGSWVHVAFPAGSPEDVFAYAIDQDAAAVDALALVGDTVVCGWLDVVAPPGGAGGPCVITFINGHGPAPSLTAVFIGGTVTGPGHKYAMGVKGIPSA